MSEIITPTCIECGWFPEIVLADGQQMFCGNPDCPVFTWNGHLSADDNRTDSTIVDLDE